MEQYILISQLNDFIFCPKSIYYHGLYNTFSKDIFQQSPQILGEAAHQSIDNKNYSTSSFVLQSLDVYSEQYNLCGKIDVLDTRSHRLTERKRNINKIYDGYVFQVYAQYYCLIEMGFKVESIYLHDQTKNKNYPIPLPNADILMKRKFTDLILEINRFNIYKAFEPTSIEKCRNCIYNNLCDSALC